MIRKLVRSMLTAQILSALTVSLCLLIDNVMVSRFLGTKAIAAYGYANPILLVIGALGSMLAAGIQMACSKSLGRGRKEETDAGFSSAVAVTLCISLFFMLVVLLFRGPLARLMGAGYRDLELHRMTKDYMAGFVVGAPGSMGALVLIPFLQIAGQSNLLIAAVLAMTVSDIALDLLNVYVLKWGMFGMGLASSLSYYIAMLFAAYYFLSSRCIFRFSLKAVSRRKIAELFTSGVPTVFNMASSVVMIFAMNQLLKRLGGTAAVAAFTVVTTIGNSVNCITTGIGGVSITLSGVFFHEEDRHALREVFSLLCRYSVVLGLAMGLLLLVASPLLVGIFIARDVPERAMAVLGLRLFGAGLVPCCLNNALKNLYQATGRIVLTELISVFECAVFPVLSAFLMSRFLGISGVWFYFVLGELLALVSIGLYIRCVSKVPPWRGDAALLLSPDFGVAEENLLELNLASMKDVQSAVRQIEGFCSARGLDPRSTNHIALCVEEMASNVIKHGFSFDNKPHHLSVRLLRKPKKWVLRFRDDCTAFDPVHYVPAEGESSLGLRIVRAMAKDIRYTSSLSLNNLIIRF